MTNFQRLAARLVASLAVSLTLAACGGGGGGGGGNNPPPPNRAPTANAGVDSTSVEGSTVTLSGTASTDPDGTIATWEWSQTAGPDVTLSGDSTATASFDAPLTDTQYTLDFQLTITDNDGATNNDSVTITIDPSEPPVAMAGPDRDVVEQDTVSLAGSATDTDGTIAAYSWVQIAGPPVTLDDPASEAPNFDTPEVTDLTTVEFELTVTDSTDDSATDTVVLTINPNEPPVVTLHFPCEGCRYFGGAPFIVTGHVSTGDDNAFVAGEDSITSLAVNTGGASVQADIDDDGKWVAEVTELNVVNGEIWIAVNAADEFGEFDSATRILVNDPTFARALYAPSPTFAGSGYLYDSYNASERLFGLDYASGTLSTIRRRSPRPNVMLSDDQLVVGTDGTDAFVIDSNADIVRMNLSTGLPDVLSSDFVTPRLMRIDRDENRLIIYDNDDEALYALDIATGTRVVLSDNAGTGTGNAFFSPTSLALDIAGNVAYLMQEPDDIIEVDLATGNRAILPASGGFLNGSAHLAHDATRARLAAFVWWSDRLYTVDTTTGARTLLSDGALLPTGGGGDVRVDAAGDRYVINDFSQNFLDLDTNRLIAVDPDTGLRSVLFTDSLGDGPPLHGSGAVTIDPASTTAWIGSSRSSTIASIDLANGDRTILSSDSAGSGPALDSLHDLEADTAGGRLFATLALGSVLEIDTATGDRTEFSGPGRGAGTALITPVAAELDLANDRLLVLDNGLHALVAIDLASGDREVISDAGNTGPTLEENGGLTLDAANDRVITTVNGSGSTMEAKVLAVDLQSGDRAELSGFAMGTGTFLDLLQDVQLLEDGTHALVASSMQFYIVNLANGNREVLVAADIGRGEALLNTRSIAYDPERDIFYTWSGQVEGFFEVDLETGARVLVSK